MRQPIDTLRFQVLAFSSELETRERECFWSVSSEQLAPR